tara:strand:- start:445 stop:744 length:300 start_codon:yes stop_codon:yes gene_type:complete
MDKSDDNLSPKQKEFANFLEKASNPKSLNSKEYLEKVELEERREVIHLNSLITKNISLFTKNPNYKLLAWLIVQLTIFSLFILTVTFLKNYLLPYINSI